MNNLKSKIDQLSEREQLSSEDLLQLITHISPELSQYLFQHSAAIRKKYYSNKIYIRGLIEFTNICQNNCYYCGIRKSNTKVFRYHLSKDDILSCCTQGYHLGFRTFVLQGGENPSENDAFLCDIVESIRRKYSDCAITLSAGERSKKSLQALFNAGADRYLLRHESSNNSHYQKLHPDSMRLETRKQCLYNLKEIGYQTGTGFMVGSPYQTPEHLVEDLLFIKEFQPEMIGVGPFIPHKDTPFATFPAGDFELTLFLIGLLRLMNPKSLIPSTTALSTIHPKGREEGLKAGANIIMPNLSPINMRKNYSLYNGKIHSGKEAAEYIHQLEAQLQSNGYEIACERGDSLVMLH